MIKFYEYFDNFEKISTLSRKLSWSHFVELLQIPDKLKRDFYATMCSNEYWSVRTLRERVASALFERTAISKKPEETIINDLQLLNNENKMTTNLFFRDPYILDFLDLKDTYSEKDLENAIISELEKFILEMGNDFAFLARQKRITIDGEDYYIDLLFYHRKMKRLVVIELKLDKFRPEYKGQVELYLKWLDKYEKAEGEESPIAIILCATKSDEYIYNFVTQRQAANLSRNMYGNDESFVSDLINSYAWDTAIVFIQKCSENVKYSKQTTINTVLANKGTNSLQIQDKVCNIFDMASNCMEWTTEICDCSGSNYVNRGDFFDRGNREDLIQELFKTDFRNSSSDKATVNSSFRPILYLR